MHTEEIEIYCLAQTGLNQDQVREWLRRLGANVRLPSNMDDGSVLCALAGKRCYKSFEVGLNPNVTKIRTDWVDYLDNILKSGHGSVLEAASYTFAIEGCSRIFCAEANRHRAGVAISEQSLRYVRFNDIGYWLPLSIRDQGEKKEATRRIFEECFNAVETWYKKLEEIWEIDSMTNFSEKKKITSMMRRIIPMGVSTGVIYTWNLRALRHILTMRCDPSAEEEICYVMGLVAKYVVERCGIMSDFSNESGFWVPRYRKV